MVAVSPVVTVLIANYNGERYVRHCVLSATRQTLRDIDIVFVDDASTDNSLAIVSELASNDPRIRIVSMAVNSGPSAARNAGLTAARGRWVAILDSDDMMEPERLAVLLAEAQRSHAQLCADDLLVFGDGIVPTSFLSERGKSARWITAVEFLLSGRMFSSIASLGYLKPLFDLEFMRTHNINYNSSLWIGEDFDLVMQLLLHGARYRFVNRLGYFYRKHPRSVSHRIGAGQLERMLDADIALTPQFELMADDRVRYARKLWRASIERALNFTHLVSVLKARDWTAALGVAFRRPRPLLLLAMPIMSRLRGVVLRKSRDRSDARRCVCIISRQHILGCTNGRSTYLLALCAAIRRAGYRLRLISPGSETFGCLPYLYLRPEVAIFDDICIRGAIRIGPRIVISSDPRVFLTAMLAVLAKSLFPAYLRRRQYYSKAISYAVAAPWRQEDILFVARQANGDAHAVIAEDAFQTPAIAYALNPDARTAVIMQDFCGNRGIQFEPWDAAGSIAKLDDDTEFALLDHAEAIVATQPNVVRMVAKRMPLQRVIFAPMATASVDTGQPGDNRTVLFVGSNTAPDVLGLRWFLESVWRNVRELIPNCNFLVAGSVSEGLLHKPDGVQFLGNLPTLDHLYRITGVVVAPSTVGAGSEVRLIEALSHGKAIVAASACVQGLRDNVWDAVTVTDDCKEFGSAIVRLLQDGQLRQKKSEAALLAANQLFSTGACFAEYLAFLAHSGARHRPSP